MRLKELIDAVSQVRRQYIAVAEAYVMKRETISPRLDDLSAAITALEEKATIADQAQDPLASHIWRSRQQIRRIVMSDKPRPRHLREVREIAHDTYGQAVKLGYTDREPTWWQLLSIGICDRM
jgi:hypothetical protein